MTNAVTPNPEAQTPPADDATSESAHHQNALNHALAGSDVGSDTRAGSLRGGSASGSDIDPDQTEINRVLADQGRASADPQSPSEADPDPIANTGVKPGDGDQDPVEGGRDADAATG